jgi:predicted transcriptional regulator of viral defense system
MPTAVPSITKSRSRLSQVLQQAGDLVSVSDVSRTLRLERSEAAKLLSRWQSQGWLRRLRHGVYAPVPLTALLDPKYPAREDRRHRVMCAYRSRRQTPV